MVADRRLFGSNSRTKRKNITSLPRSGKYGKRSVVASGYWLPKGCPCGTVENDWAAVVGCFIITNEVKDDPCDWIVFETTGDEFDQAIENGFPIPGAEYIEGYTPMPTTTSTTTI